MQRFALFSLLLLGLFACTEPITVGESFLAGERAGLGRATIPFTTRTVAAEPLTTFRSGNMGDAVVELFHLGQTDDEVFGRWSNGVYLTPRLPRSGESGVRRPEFSLSDTILVDSVVLILPIDTVEGFYGLGRTFPVRLRSLASPVFRDQDYESDLLLPTNDDRLNAEDQFSASAQATILYDTIYSSGDTISRIHARIRMAQEFVDRINTLDTLAFESDTTFWDVFPGVDLEITDESGALVPVRPRNSNGSASFGGFYFFYQDPAPTDPASFYSVGFNLWLPHYRRDYSGSLAGQLLAGTGNDEVTLVGGQSSVLTEITLTDLSVLDDRLVNEAVFNFYEFERPNYDTDAFPNARFLGLYYRDEDANLIPIQDQRAVTNAQADVVQSFLGSNRRTDTDGRTLYVPRISVHLQRIVDGEVPPVLYLRVLPVDNDPSRAVLRGPAASELPSTLTVTYTNVDG